MPDLLTRVTQSRWTGPLAKAVGIPPTPELQRAGPEQSDEDPLGRVHCNQTPCVEEIIGALGGSVDQASGTTDAPIRQCLFDATEMQNPERLDEVYGFFHDVLAHLAPSARILLIGPAAATEPAAAATREALGGFVRSLAKEVGRKGSTANLLLASPDMGAALHDPVRFFLSPRSAFVTGQTLQVRAPVGESGAPASPRTALITGAARGLGAATARTLAADGARVTCVDVPHASEPLAALVDEIGGEAVELDITAPDAASSLTAPDILVHNAGVTRDKTLRRMTPEMWGLVMDVNLRAVLRLDDALLPEMRSGGRAVYLSSINGIAGSVGQTNYAATKAALIGYVRAIAPGLASRGITANAVAPGFINTAMTAKMPTLRRELAGRANSLLQPGEPEDVAEAIAFLARPGSYGVTGQTLRVCGQNMIGA